MKYILEDDFEYDFKLIGISCHEKDYRICWGINKQLSLNLSKETNKIEFFNKKKNIISKHSIFSYIDFDTENEISLITNRSNAGFLIPEQKHADYLLMIKGEDILYSIKNTISNIKKIKFVLTAFEIEVSQLKSKDNLIF